MKSYLYRRLEALNYPFLESLDFIDQQQLTHLVWWLENAKIRRYEIADREFLRNPTDFFIALKQYITDLGANADEVEKLMSVEGQLTFLVDFAVDLCFNDLVEEGSEQRFVQERGLKNQLSVDPELKNQLSEVAFKLGLPEPQNTIGVLRTLQRLLQKCRQVSEKDDFVISIDQCDGSLSFPKELEEEIPLGFTTGDAVVDNICRILRILYCKDLKDLQSRINKMIASFQLEIAHPRTDVSRARVGR